ncbi:MAG: hypothetical protein J3Q66DRAFT_342840 [Benniella sp.]|nr:MAG: hypothetical protein J3Q66DRAFT_342840 [Benniella sp.]
MRPIDGISHSNLPSISFFPGIILLRRARLEAATTLASLAFSTNGAFSQSIYPTSINHSLQPAWSPIPSIISLLSHVSCSSSLSLFLARLWSPDLVQRQCGCRARLIQSTSKTIMRTKRCSAGKWILWYLVPNAMAFAYTMAWLPGSQRTTVPSRCCGFECRKILSNVERYVLYHVVDIADHRLWPSCLHPQLRCTWVILCCL